MKPYQRIYEAVIMRRNSAEHSGVVNREGSIYGRDKSGLLRRLADEMNYHPLPPATFAASLERRIVEAREQEAAPLKEIEALRERLAELTAYEVEQHAILQAATPYTPVEIVLDATQKLQAARFLLRLIPRKTLKEDGNAPDAAPSAATLKERAADSLSRWLVRLREEENRIMDEADALGANGAADSPNWAIGPAQHLVGQLEAVTDAIHDAEASLSAIRRERSVMSSAAAMGERTRAPDYGTLPKQPVGHEWKPFKMGPE